MKANGKTFKYSISFKRDMGEWFEKLLDKTPGRSPSACVQKFMQPAFDAWYAEKLAAIASEFSGVTKVAETRGAGSNP